MPLLIDDKLVLLRIPKTASKAMQFAVLGSLGAQRVTIVGNTHWNLQQSADLIGGRFHATLVRQPHSWLQSVWGEFFLYFRNTGGTDPGSCEGSDVLRSFIEECWSPSFSTYVERYLRRYSGWIGPYFDSFAAGGLIGRKEHVFDDLEWILNQTNIPYTRAALRHDKRPNQAASTPELRSRVRYPQELLSEVVRVEKEVYDRYYASESIEVINSL